MDSTGLLMRVTNLFAVFLLFALAQSCSATAMGTAPDEERASASRSYDRTEEVFLNEKPTDTGLNWSKLRDVMRRYRENEQRPAGPIPLASTAPALFDSPIEEGVRITWVGHSTLLVEIDGFRILTDPVWSKRVSPFPTVGPSRFHAPGVALDDLPPIDLVIISHDHYDHLDHDSVSNLAWRGAQFLLPVGVGSHFALWGIERYVELDWWDEITLEKNGRRMTFVATPARHFSGRGLLDRNKTLWASWVLIGDTHRVYFGGDTGYFSGFREIGERFGPFDAALLPIGAYDPAWADIHLNPEEAAQAYIDLGGRGTFIPIHYATFSLAAHAWDEPMERLLTAVEQHAIGDYAFPIPGEIVVSGHRPPQKTWWRAIAP